MLFTTGKAAFGLDLPLRPAILASISSLQDCLENILAWIEVFGHTVPILSL